MPRYHEETVLRFVRKIEANEFLLPNIQRDLVWKPEQILKLLDSFLRGYPVGTLLIWRTRQAIECRKFIQNYTTGMKFWDQPWTGTDRIRQYVLDGQQRLQALYIALLGTYDGQKVYLDLLPRDEDREAEMRFTLRFRRDADPRQGPKPTEVLLRDIILGRSDFYTKANEYVAALAKEGRELTVTEQAEVGRLIATIWQQLVGENALSYYVADETADSELTLDDVLEIFIRTNSGGTQLDPSDLIFSVVAAEWKGVRPLLEDFLDELNQRGNFGFSMDDLLRVSLVLTGKGAAYNLQHFRGNDARANVAAIREAWPSMSETIRWVADFVRGDAQLKSDHLLVSYNAILPLMAYVHHRDLSRVGLADKNAMRRWLYRVLLERQFGGAAVTTVNQCVYVIREPSTTIFPERSLYKALGLTDEPSQESILDRGKRSPQESVLPLFIAYMDSGLSFPSMNPLYTGNTPEVDHIIPKAKLVQLYQQAGRSTDAGTINNIGNYRVVAQDENRHKSDQWPREFYHTSQEWNSFLSRHLLPEDIPIDAPISLETYEKFVEARRKLLFEHIRKVLTPAGLT